MPRVPKSRIVSALLLLLMLSPWSDAHPADAPPPKGLATTAEESEVNPHRAPRPLSRREIFQAIQNDLARRGISGREGLRPGDLKIQSSVPGLEENMGLEVKKIGFDPIRQETVFELWTSHEPQYLPFDVTTRRDPQSWGGGLLLACKPGEPDRSCRAESPVVGQGVNLARSKAPVLAKPGKPATLVMLGQNVRITTTVVPLQPGIKGQVILVRDPATARVMSAEVVDAGQLRTSF